MPQRCQREVLVGSITIAAWMEGLDFSLGRLCRRSAAVSKSVISAYSIKSAETFPYIRRSLLKHDFDAFQSSAVIWKIHVALEDLWFVAQHSIDNFQGTWFRNHEKRVRWFHNSKHRFLFAIVWIGLCTSSYLLQYVTWHYRYTSPLSRREIVTL